MEATKKQITEYVKKTLELYDLNYTAYFHDYDDNNQCVSAPIFGKNSIESKIDELVELLGLTKEEILNLDKEANHKWYNKYCFFTLYKRFEASYARTFYGPAFAEEYLLSRIFGEDAIKISEKYNENNIKERTISLLKEINTVLPGSYHEGAKMNNFKWDTNQFCSFPHVHEMIDSLLEMINRAKELFFKAKEISLNDEEINEYNFLVTVLGIHDIASNHFLYYKNVVALREVYKEEGCTDFYDFVKYARLKNLAPWRSREFALDKEKVQKFFNEYPQCFADMQRFAKTISRISCFFVWSDAPFTQDNEEIAELRDEPYQEPTVIYVDKTDDELGNDKKYAEKLLELVGPLQYGGIRPTTNKRGFNINRASSHIIALGRKNND